MDTGLLVVRLLLAGILFAHATQKARGWFSGPGMVGATAIFDKLGQHPAKTMVRVAVTCELAASLLLLLGLATPLAAAIGAGTMLVAGASMMQLSGSFWNSAGGGEYPFVLALACAAVAFTGAGAVSLDAAVSAPWHDVSTGTANLLGLAALVVAVLAAIVPISRARSAARATSAATDTPAPAS